MYNANMDKNGKPTYKLNIKKNIEAKIGKGDHIPWLMWYAKITRPTAVRLVNDEGVKIELATLRKLADALDVPVQDLLTPVN